MSARTRTRHSFNCVVDGGHLRHGRNGFTCPRCAELHAQDREFLLLNELDRVAR